MTYFQNIIILFLLLGNYIHQSELFIQNRYNADSVRVEIHRNAHTFNLISLKTFLFIYHSFKASF